MIEAGVLKIYQVIDRVTKQPMGKHSRTIQAARKKVDRLDNLFGGYRYGIITTGE